MAEIFNNILILYNLFSSASVKLFSSSSSFLTVLFFFPMNLSTPKKYTSLGSTNSFKFSRKSILSPLILIIKSFILITYFFKISRVKPKFKALEEIESMEKSALVQI